jgi:PIN domain nuclease of toxin-antitoxin system
MLLDTHVLLWLVDDRLHTRVPGSVRAQFESAQHRLISSASAYEIALKAKRGRLPGGQSVLDGWSTVLRNLRATELPLAVPHMARAGSLDWDHRDPFDRMLVAQSQLEGVELLTLDGRIRAYDQVRTATWPDS